MIAVVGGGVTGLALGWELRRLGADFLVLEGADRPGGVIRSGNVDGHVVDWGPQRIRLTKRMAELIGELGLESDLVTAPPGLDLFVFSRRRLRRVPFSATGFLTSNVVSVGGRVRAALEPFTGRARAEESVANFFSRKFGREMYETVLGPLYGGLYASDPADMQVGLSLIHVLREFGVGRSLVLRFLSRGGRISPPPACSFRGGMQTLPEALARSLGERVRLDSPVGGLASDGAGWQVHLANGERVAADRVVVTTPAPVAARLLRTIAPAAGAALEALHYNPLAVVPLEAETELRGMGFQVAFSERDLTLRGVTFNDSLFGRRNLYTAYLGGALHPEVESAEPARLGELAESQFRRTTGYEGRALSIEHVRMPAWDRSWRALDGLSLPEGVYVAGGWWARPGVAGRLAEARGLGARLAKVRPRP